METEGRWSVAQDYERKHWEKLARKIVEGRSDLRWYKWKADRTMSRLRACGIEPKPAGTVAEVGSGPVGQAGFLPAATRMAFDPLMEFFESEAALLKERPQNVRYVRSKGEQLPAEDRSCDLVVIDNCLDHCENPTAVLQEIRRVLKPDGHLYLTLNIRPVPGWLVRRVAEETLRLDRGHPYSYHPALLRRTIASAGFVEMKSWIQSWGSAARENWAEGRLRTMVKLASLTNERLYEGVWKCTPRDSA